MAARYPIICLVWVLQVTACGRIGFEQRRRGGLRRAGSDQFISHGTDNSQSPGIIIFQVASSADKVSGTGWHHVLSSWDTEAGVAQIFVNDAPESIDSERGTGAGDTAYTFGASEWSVGARNNGNSQMTGYLADLWFDADLFLDLSVEANRRKFINASGAPVDLGLDGTLPTGESPDVFLSGETPSWHVNRGTGGGYSVNGNGLTTAPSRPGDNFLQPSSVGWSSAALNVMVHVSAAFQPSDCEPAISNVVADSMAGTTGSSMTIPGYTVPAMTDGMLIVAIASEDDDNASGGVPAMVTFGGVPLTEAITATGAANDKTASLYYLAAPAGTGDITVVTTGTVEAIQVGAYVASCVVAQSPIGTTSQTKFTARLTTGIIGVPEGSLVVDSLEHGGTEAGSLTVTRAGQIPLFTQDTKTTATSSQASSYRIAVDDCGG